MWAPVVVINLSAMTILCRHQTAMPAAAVPASFAGAVPGLTTGPDTVGWILARVAWMPVFAGRLMLIARYARRFEAQWQAGTRACECPQGGGPAGDGVRGVRTGAGVEENPARPAKPGPPGDRGHLSGPSGA